MVISASQVKELREKTGAGMMDCKKALTECEGDLKKAIEWLKEKGIAKAAKKAGRIAAEGLCKVKAKDNKAVILEVNSETDFVAKNEQFISLIDTTLDVLLANNPQNLEEALALSVNDKTLGDLFIDATSTIGEKIVLRRFEIVNKNDDEIFGLYIHMGGKISVITTIKGSTNEAVAKDMAMQVASMNPLYVSKDAMPLEVIEKEREAVKNILLADETMANKPEAVLEKIAEGRLSKSLEEISLADQIYFREQKLKCSEFLKQHNAQVVKFVRYEVGEGIEKREENFADEVAKQIAK